MALETTGSFLFFFFFYLSPLQFYSLFLIFSFLSFITCLFIYFPFTSVISDDISYLIRIPVIEEPASKFDRLTGTSVKGINRDGRIHGWMIRIGIACANHVENGI